MLTIDEVIQANANLARRKSSKRAAYQFAPRRVDANHKALIKAARQLGLSVVSTHTAGNGFPDTVFAYRWLNVPVEIKDGDKTSSHRQFTPKEEDFFRTWPGLRAVACNVNDVNSIARFMKRFVESMPEFFFSANPFGNQEVQYHP